MRGGSWLLTWAVLHTERPTAVAPWEPAGASWWQSGHGTDGRSHVPERDGRWWSVLATWPDGTGAAAPPPATDGVESWHVVLDARSGHGDLVMADGARPFDGLVTGSPPTGPVALVTVAGGSADEAREREFARRFHHVGRDVERAPGHLLTLVHTPATAAGTGPVVLLSLWRDLAAGLDWAYTTSRPHTSAVTRQAEKRLVEVSASLRCAVVSSGGSIGEWGDPLADVVGH